MELSYLETTKNVYKEAAENPQIGLCCTTTPIWQLPGLDMPVRMQQMNYGCGSTVHPRDLITIQKYYTLELGVVWSFYNLLISVGKKME